MSATQNRNPNLNARAVYVVDSTTGLAAPSPGLGATLATATGAAAAAVTLTIPAGATGVFNYLTWLQIVQYAAAALTGSATPILVTTTGLPGNPVFTFPTAAAIGTEFPLVYEGQPIKGSAAATAITIVCPATTGVIWRVNAAYYQQ